MKTQLNFANDYLQGAHPNILKRMMETNQVEMTGFERLVTVPKQKFAFLWAGPKPIKS